LYLTLKFNSIFLVRYFRETPKSGEEKGGWLWRIPDEGISTQRVNVTTPCKRVGDQLSWDSKTPRPPKISTRQLSRSLKILFVELFKCMYLKLLFILKLSSLKNYKFNHLIIILTPTNIITDLF